MIYFLVSFQKKNNPFEVRLECFDEPFKVNIKS